MDKTRNVRMSSTRRKVLVAISQITAVSTLSACGRGGESVVAQSRESDVELLAGVAYDILPFPELPPAPYLNAAQQILDLDSADVVAGLAKLREFRRDTAWRELPEGDRLALLSSWEGNAFFALLRATTVRALLRNPATFAIVGYGGPSIQLGGYLSRGFDDIDWLTAAARK